MRKFSINWGVISAGVFEKDVGKHSIQSSRCCWSFSCRFFWPPDRF